MFATCSAPQPKNKWQFEAVNMTQAYQNHFLQGKTRRASLDLKHAKQLSKQSADFQTLIDVELTQCAMNLSVLKAQNCEHVTSLLQVQPNAKQEAYLALLSSTLESKDIDLLPKQYQNFARALEKKDTELINEALRDIKPLSSKLISSSVSLEYISNENIIMLIDELSYSGYKNPLISWLRVQASKETNETKKVRIQAKIKVLLSK